MTVKHTPGPWVVSFGQRICAVAEGPPVAQAWGGSGSAQQLATAEANARLIAAAPDMLKALEDMLYCLEQWVEIADDEDQRQRDHDAIAAARAAIAKARGE